MSSSASLLLKGRANTLPPLNEFKDRDYGIAPQQLRQLCHVDRDAARLVAGERLVRCARIIEIDVAELLAAAVLDDEPGFAFFDSPGRWEAARVYGWVGQSAAAGML